MWNSAELEFPENAKTLMVEDELDEALAICRNYTDHADKLRRKQAYLLMTNIHQEKREPETAIKAAVQALEIDPEDPDTWYVFGLCAEKMGLPMEAWIALQQAENIDPNHPYAAKRLKQVKASFPGDVGKLKRQILDHKSPLDPSCLEVRFLSAASIRHLRIANLCKKLNGTYHPLLVGVLSAPTEWVRMPKLFEVLGVLFKKNFYRLVVVLSILLLFLNYSVLQIWQPLDDFEGIRSAQFLSQTTDQTGSLRTYVANWEVIRGDRPGSIGIFSWALQKYVVSPAVVLGAKVLVLVGPWLIMPIGFISLIAGDSFNGLLFIWGLISNFFAIIGAMFFGYLGYCLVTTLTRLIDVATQTYRFADNRLYLWTGVLSRRMTAIELHRIVSVETQNVGLHRVLDYGRVDFEYKNNIEQSKFVTLHSVFRNSVAMFEKTDSILNLIFELRDLIKDGPR